MTTSSPRKTTAKTHQKTCLKASQEQPSEQKQVPVEVFKQELQISGALLMYVGNLESYQGIDLLLDSFATILPSEPTTHLVIIGGSADDIQKYQAKTYQQKTEANVHLVGPRPIERLKQYLAQADIVVSPRTQGDNTPMKLYSYLDSGKALIATNLATHTQVLTDQMAMLAEPTVAAFSQGILQLLNSPELRRQLGQSAREYIAKEHTYEVFSSKLSALYDWIQHELSISQ